MEKQSILTEKQCQRNAGKAARKSLTKQQRQQFSEAICQTVATLDDFQQARTVLIYAAFGAEASVDLLPERFPDKRFFYPVCLPDFQMTAARPLDSDGWEVGEYGIRTPILSHSELAEPEAFDLVLVPCTAFDETCRRVGMGKGYYDRYLVRCVNALKIGIAFACQKVDCAAVEDFDVPLDCYVTEKDVYWGTAFA